MLKKNEENYLIGDITIDILNPDQDGELYLNNLYENSFVPLIYTITFPTHKDGSCINHIFGKKFSNIKTIKCKQLITNHYPIILILKKVNLKTESKTKSKHI